MRSRWRRWIFYSLIYIAGAAYFYARGEDGFVIVIVPLAGPLAGLILERWRVSSA